jgi:hypothetical protein
MKMQLMIGSEKRNTQTFIVTYVVHHYALVVSCYFGQACAQSPSIKLLFVEPDSYYNYMKFE